MGLEKQIAMSHLCTNCAVLNYNTNARCDGQRRVLSTFRLIVAPADYGNRYCHRD